MLGLEERDEGCRLAVRVQPKASRTAIVGFHGDRLKVALAAPALEGKANKALVQFFAKLSRIPKSRVSILSGEKSREKTLFSRGSDRQSIAPHSG
ncbi:YggU family protein [bacterium]|nr:YggU family protein [bacterium]